LQVRVATGSVGNPRDLKLGVPMRGSCSLLSREILEVMTGVLESKLEIEKPRPDRRNGRGASRDEARVLVSDALLAQEKNR
jgi:hypothetical protein